MQKVVAVGLDAAEWWLVEKLMAKGRMPNLAALQGRGAACRLENIQEYRAETPWTQFATGLPPMDTRYWSMVTFDPSTYDVWERGSYEYDAHKPFWAAMPDRRSIVFDVPQVRIDEGINGLHVTGWGAHSPQYPRASQPRGLLSEIDQTFGAHPAFDEDNEPCWFDPEFLSAMGDALIDGARARVDVLEWLMAREPEWDLVTTVMSESHSAGHHCWHGIDARHTFHGVATTELARDLVTRVYSTIDEQIGRLVSKVPDDTTVMAFSVHGMQPNAGDLSGPLFAELFHRLTFGEQLLTTVDARRWRRAGRPAIEPPGRWSLYMKGHFSERPPTGLAAAARRALPAWLLEARRTLRNRGRATPERVSFPPVPIPPETDLTPDELAGGPRTEIYWQIPCWYRRFWPQMRAFVLPTYSDAHIRINLQGREQFGVVARDDYERACQEVEEAVRACRDPRTGEPVVDEVVRMRADDPFDPEGPHCDLIIIPRVRPFDALEHPDAGTIGPYPLFRTGEHSSNGFAILAGPGVPAGVDLGVRSAHDVTPTIIDLLGAPTDGMAGSSLLAGAEVT